MMILLLFLSLLPLISTVFFNQDLNITRFDIDELTRRIDYQNYEKLVVLQLYGQEYAFLGGRNHAYNISLNGMREIERFEWMASDESRQNCGAISQNPTSCENYIRTFFELTNTTFILCGTHALQPMCAEFRKGEKQQVRTIQSIGMSPIDADSISPFIRSNDNIITVNVAELSSSEPLLIRRNVLKMWKGIDNDVILRTPRGQSSFEQANFLSMHKNNNEIMFFFSESPMDNEGCGLHKVARVGRICEDDPGGRMSYSKEWSSYAKARLECSIEETDTDTFYFNQFASITESTSSYYGAFRSQLAGIGASAICRYDKKSISVAISNGYKDTPTDSCARANDIEELTKMRQKPLIRQKISAHPIYIFHGKDRFIHVVVQENVRNLKDEIFDVLYVATNLGNILKVVIPKDGGKTMGRHVLTLKAFKPSTKISSMSLSNQQLIIITDQSVLNIPTTICELSTTCADCLGTNDPECAWASTGECIDIRKEARRKKYSSQDSGTCDLTYEVKPVSLAPLKPKESQPTCLCETTTALPCTTEVIQKEIIQYASQELWKYIAVFASGLLIGSIFNCMWAYCSRIFDGKSIGSIGSTSSTRGITTSDGCIRQPIDAFTTSSIADEMFSSTISNNNRFNTISMHSSIRTYC